MKRFVVRRRVCYDIDAVVEAPNEKIARKWAVWATTQPINMLDQDRLLNISIQFGSLKFEEVPDYMEVLVTIPIDKEGKVDRGKLKQMLRKARKS